jgi:hypothetical protein
MTTATKVKAPPKPKFIRFRTVEGTVSGFIDDAFSEITDLGDEFREMYDNAPENLQQTGVNQTRDETASACESLNEPDCSNNILSELSAYYSADFGKLYRGRVAQSRACRASNCAAAFNAAAEAVRQWVDDNPPLDDDASKQEKRDHELTLAENGWDADTFSEAHDQADTLIGECEDCASEIESMEWPGMFG